MPSNYRVIFGSHTNDLCGQIMQLAFLVEVSQYLLSFSSMQLTFSKKSRRLATLSSARQI